MKRFFVPMWLMLVAAMAAHAIWALSVAPTLAWVGVVMATATVMVFFGVLFLRTTARTSARLPGVGAVIAVGAVVSWSGLPSAALPAAYGGAVLLGWFAYVSWYSRFGRQPSAALRLGEPLPDFTVYAADGAARHATELVGRPALVLFFRGNWCPLCMAQIREIAAGYRELAARGVQVWLISPQSQGHTRALAGRFDVPFDFLTDADGQAARILDIFDAAGTPAGMEMLGYEAATVLPTAIVLDASGRVILADQTDNYRVRPEPATFLAVLDGRAPSAGEAAA